MRRTLLLTAAACAIMAPVGAIANEIINYSYDARGRLVKVEHSGTVNDGVVTSYTLDKADNRLNKTVTISPTPSFAVNDVAATEGAALVFTVSRTGSTSSTLTVNYATANGSAVAGSDYTATSGTLSFAPSESSKTISISTSDDASVESAETLTLTLSAASGGAAVSDAQGTGTINDNDTASAGVSFSIGDASVTEGGSLVFTVTKSGSSTASSSVNFATGIGTAGSTDFTATSGTLTFAAADITKTISVVTRQDSFAEGDETMVVNLSAPSAGATIGDAQGLGTILNYDGGSCPTCAPPVTEVTEPG